MHSGDEEDRADIVLHPELVDETGLPVVGGLTVSEAAAHLGVSPADVRRYIRLGRLPAQRFIGLLGSEYRLATADVESLHAHLDLVDDEATGAGAVETDAPSRSPSTTPADSPDLYAEVLALHDELTMLRQDMTRLERLSAEREVALRSEMRAIVQGTAQRQAATSADQQPVQNTPSAQERRPWWWVLRRRQDR